MGQAILDDGVAALVKAFKCLMLLLVVMTATACATDPDDESIVVGTGMTIRGAVSEQQLLARGDLQIRSQSGETSSSVIARDGQYIAQSLPGEGPWLLESYHGNDDYLYGIAYASGIAHVHSYTDLIIRSWFLEQHGLTDIHTAFVAQETLPAMPTPQEFLSRAQRYFSVVELVLEDYKVSAEELLNSRDFRNDDTGVDLFLDANPVLLDGRELTIVKTERVKNTQSFFNGDILLQGTDQSTPPPMPENLRAFGSSSDGIALVWDSTTGNIPIVSYAIVRNGELIAITPYTTYADKEVSPNTLYTYEVQSIGIDGTRSVGSSISTNSTTSAIDTIAPATPGNLTKVVATTRRAELVWTYDSVSDVIGFDVFRGPTVDDLSFLTQVTSTRVVDATVSSAIEYCYAVRAVDASGNSSALSEAVCVLTSGIVIVPPQRPLNLVPALAGLSVPDIESLSCETSFPDYNIDDKKVTINPGCYRVEQNINVINFGVLTLNPGVVLKFDQNTGIKTEYTGTLVSVGTAAMPVVMTASRQTRGWWTGVWFNHTENPANQISYTVIEYAGAEPTGANILLESATNDPAFLSVDNSLIRHGSGYGIDIPGLDARLQSFNLNLVTQNGRAAAVNHSSLPAITDGSDFAINDLNFIYVSRAHYALDLELFDPGIPVILNSIDQEPSNPPRTIIIHEGVEMRFTSGDAFNVRGNLAIRGTASNPVKLTSKNPNPGGWEGLQLLDGANAQLSHVIIENAGQPSEENPAGASLFANNARLELENVTLRFSASYGFHAAGDCVTVGKFERVSNVNNAREDIVDPVNLIPCL